MVKQLSYLLAAQASSRDPVIIIELYHGLCLAMDASFQPCYTLSLTMSSDSDHSDGEMNGSFIQMFTSNVLGIPQHRSVLFYQDAEVGCRTAKTVLALEESASRKEQRRSFTDLDRPSVPPQRISHARLASLARLNGDEEPSDSFVTEDETTIDDRYRLGTRREARSSGVSPEPAKREADVIEHAGRDTNDVPDAAGDGITHAITNDGRTGYQLHDSPHKTVTANGRGTHLHRISTKARSASTSGRRLSRYSLQQTPYAQSLTALPLARSANTQFTQSPAVETGKKNFDYPALPTVPSETQVPQVPPEPETEDPVIRKKMGRRKSFVMAFKLATAAD